MAASVNISSWAMICLGLLVVNPSTADVVIPPPAYQLAAHQAGVPPALLYAIALQESGTDLQGRQIPWPWTLNIAGQPRRFMTRDAACAALHNALDQRTGQRIDVGLGQINVGYHVQRVTQLCDLLDPYQNLTVAATILREQYKPAEGWLNAAGSYHRPAGGEPAERYRSSIQQRLSGIRGGSQALTAHQEVSP